MISIGIVAEDGRTLYLESSEFDESQVNDFVREHVLPNLQFPPEERRTRQEIAAEVIGFVHDDNPVFVGYYADYDWVVFCWLFGRMVDLPDNFPMYCWDLKQELDRLGLHVPNSLEPAITHNALDDAHWTKAAHEWMIEHSGPTPRPRAASNA